MASAAAGNCRVFTGDAGITVGVVSSMSRSIPKCAKARRTSASLSSGLCKHPSGRVRIRRQASASGAPAQALQAEPLLGPEALAVVASALLGQLVADAGGLVAAIETGRAEQQVPHRKQHREVAAPQRAGPLALVPHADGVVLAVKTRAHQQALTQPAEAQAGVGVRQALE